MSERKITMILPNSPEGVKCGLDSALALVDTQDYRIMIDCCPITEYDIGRIKGKVEEGVKQYMLENLRSYTYTIREFGERGAE